ncbi:nucleotide cyclase [Baffinella frigidus]|nr:nucleotide cyclase [Cryptophyta sp. CCMP2293]
MRDNPDAKASCETRIVVVLVLDLCNLSIITYINNIFSAFDREVKKQGLFKMDTIGDAYVAAGWLNSLDPAEATERCAAMIRLSQRLLRVLAVSGQDVRCRIGISKGVVYAGVLGRLQPRYHLFGEPMRIAEQLGSRGAVDSVHVSAPAPEEVSQAWTGNSSTRAREREREGYPASSEMDWTEVDIAAGDEGNLFVRSSTAPDIRLLLATCFL